ncbi:MAG: urea ABC transporter substrate-binding protein [Pseudomonadota bacterium]
MMIKRIHFRNKAFTLILLGILSTITLYAQANTTTIRIGILHSLSGAMAVSGQPLVDAVTLAVSEINANGGLLGKQVEIIVVDGKSNWPLFAKEATHLIKNEKVSAIFGCWTSSCRKAVKPIVEKLDNLLFYPVQYEGLEESPNIIYTGATPNQQIIPGVSWALKNLGKRLYLIGSDYIFPHAANQIIKDISKAQKGVILKEEYISLGSNTFNSQKISQIISDIKKYQPNVILNTINGNANHLFFNQLQSAGIDNIPVISFSISEPELAKIKSAQRNNHYTVWNYFQSIDNEENQHFISQFKQLYGKESVIGDPMEASYIAIKLWAQAVREARSEEPKRVNKSIRRQSLKAPQGIVSVDPETRHLWKAVRIGQAQTNGQFKIIWQTKHPIQPKPFPSYRTKHQWQKLLKTFSKKTVAEMNK